MGLLEAVGKEWLVRHVAEAFEEDLGGIGDITCDAILPSDLSGKASLYSKQRGRIAGLDWVTECGNQVNPPVSWSYHVSDGDRVESGTRLASAEGSLSSLLVCERTALNGLAHLSGIATMATSAVEAVEGTCAVVLETRKTMPGWRRAEKYAVRTGGAMNHRMGLYDEILIKENHISAAGGIREAIKAAKKWRRSAAKDNGRPERSNVIIEVEVRNLEELYQAIDETPDRILLDNFSFKALEEAVRISEPSGIPLEASGGITLENISQVAATGVHRISLGALTHSVRPLDLTLLVQ